MGNRVGAVTSIVMLAGFLGIVAATGVAEAGDGMSGAKMTWSTTKDYTASPWTNEVGWSSRAMSKLGFGVKNLLLGWTDLFVEPKEAMNSGGNFFAGLGSGVMDTLGNEIGGVLHILTFPLTELDVPLPEGGTQVLSS